MNAVTRAIGTTARIVNRFQKRPDPDGTTCTQTVHNLYTERTPPLKSGSFAIWLTARGKFLTSSESGCSPPMRRRIQMGMGIRRRRAHLFGKKRHIDLCRDEGGTEVATLRLQLGIQG